MRCFVKLLFVVALFAVLFVSHAARLEDGELEDYLKLTSLRGKSGFVLLDMAYISNEWANAGAERIERVAQSDGIYPTEESFEMDPIKLVGRSAVAKPSRFRPYMQGEMTCDRNIKVCRAKGSPDRNCCQRKCVDLETDRCNCGKCGKKCKYSETCCKGKCVNPMFNRKHCGGCNNSCGRGSLCAYGMCGYA